MKEKGTFFWQALLAGVIVIAMFALWTVLRQREVIVAQNEAMHALSAQLTRDEVILKATHDWATELMVTLVEMTGIEPVQPASETLRTEWRVAK